MCVIWKKTYCFLLYFLAQFSTTMLSFTGILSYCAFVIDSVFCCLLGKRMPRSSVWHFILWADRGALLPSSRCSL